MVQLVVRVWSAAGLPRAVCDSDCEKCETNNAENANNKAKPKAKGDGPPSCLRCEIGQIVD